MHLKNQNKTILNITYVDTDLGLMIACASKKGICMFEFADQEHIELQISRISKAFKVTLLEGENPHFDTLRQQLKEYFKGERKEFNIPLDLVGTDFQKKVWKSLIEIPYGSTISYGEQAKLIGKPKAVRAVANANAKNKVSIILPCHRVIGADGKLTGYGGGLWRKEKLLELEKQHSVTK
ncbi:MAG TPA: methylated-DNA--[protein]-cysteine S-methyltransferase [Paludibacter sp.]|nr:methylated-DNA--[protein]-cysteine S-methyltransferase [Paludibacter sp.]HOS46128.1 methylated-DNA--[protein]-cysteine S-methyltransferase [Paludibacter sp.]